MKILWWQSFLVCTVSN